MAHEINNPLGYVLGNIGYVLDELPGLVADAVPALAEDPRLGELLSALTDAREGAERIGKVVRDLRVFSRAEDDGRELVDLRAILESTCAIAMPTIRQRARFMNVLAELPRIRGSEGRLAQLFLNLLVNAAQAIDNGPAEQNEVSVRAQVVRDGAIQVDVSDSGRGIGPDAIERIFDPFVTRRRVGGGAGLSLAICQSIATAHGGIITVVSKLGKGTTFSVKLPSGEARATPRARESDAPASAVKDRRGRILIVDDEPAIAASLKRLLGRQHDVSAALSGREALDLLAKQDFDLVLCDIMMPDVSGMDVFEGLGDDREAEREKFVFMTGGAFTTRSRTFLEGVPNVRISKPFEAAKLRALVRDRVSKARRKE